MMKKLGIIFLLFFVVFACKEDDIFKGATVAFYPTIGLNVLEEDPNSYNLALSASGIITDGATVKIKVTNGTFLNTTPAIEGDMITLELTPGNSEISIGLTIGDDDIAGDYEAVFEIASVSGDIKSISNGTFTLFVEDNDQEVIFEDNFETGSLANWTTFSTEGSNDWEIRTFADNFYAIISNFSSAGVAEDWLISPEIPFDSFQSEKLSFKSQTAFNDGNLLEVVVLTDYSGTGDPSGATITTLTPMLDPHRGGGFGTFTDSGILDLSGVTGNGYIAFHYKAADAADGSQWQVDDVMLEVINTGGGSVGGGGSGGGGGGGSLYTLPFSDNFEGCTDDFATPGNFIEEFVAGSKTDRGWGCRDEGVDGSRAVRASGFGGDAGTDNAWLISENKFDLKSVTSAYVSFDVKSAFDGPGDLMLKWSSDYTGSGDPSMATWTELTDLSGQLPDKGTNTFSNAVSNLSAAAGNEVYVALQFDGGMDSSSGSYEIDNFSVTENEPSGGGGGGGGGSTDVFGLPFSDDFENCTDAGDFNIPENWTEHNIAGTKTDRGWGCRSFGRDGSNGVQASAFGGEEGDDNAWLISAKPFDLTGVSSASLNFWVESFFDGPGSVTVKWSSNYSGTGDPTSATWTELTDANGNFPAGGSQVFTEVTGSLDAAAGEEVYIAFQYNGASDSGSSSWTLDDLTVSAN